MPDDLYAGQDFISEAPINLPANRQDPEYGSDVMVDLLAEMGFDYVMLTPAPVSAGFTTRWSTTAESTSRR